MSENQKAHDQEKDKKLSLHQKIQQSFTLYIMMVMYITKRLAGTGFISGINLTIP